MKKFSILVLMTSAFTHWCNAQVVLPDLQLISFSSGYTLPIDIENCGDSRLFIVQKTGQIFICDSTGKKRTNPFLDISAKIYSVGNEQGLLGLAFDPNYSSNGFFYVNYINKQKNTTVARFTVSSNPNKANAKSEKVLLIIKQPYNNHNGGCVKFGADGYLYIGMGDGGNEGDPKNYGQNTMTLLGKMLRIDVEHGNPYAIPPDNPFVGNPNYKPEIWNVGMRNPWRFSFDASTGDLWIGDVGQDNWEEIDMQNAGDPGGENYGWRCYEGDHPYNLSGCGSMSEYSFPISEYPHDSGDCAITGGYVYRGSKYPNMYGKYFYCDYCSGDYKVLYKSGGNWLSSVLIVDAASDASVTFGQDDHNEIYTSNYSTGVIYHLVDASHVTGREMLSQPASARVKIYPNPSNGIFTVSYLAASSVSCDVTVINAMGQIMYAEKRAMHDGLNNWKLNVANLPKGNYWVKIFNEGSMEFAPLVIQ